MNQLKLKPHFHILPSVLLDNSEEDCIHAAPSIINKSFHFSQFGCKNIWHAISDQWGSDSYIVRPIAAQKHLINWAKTCTKNLIWFLLSLQVKCVHWTKVMYILIATCWTNTIIKHHSQVHFGLRCIRKQFVLGFNLISIISIIFGPKYQDPTNFG